MKLTTMANIRAEQSVCTNLNENAVTRSFLLGSKNVISANFLRAIWKALDCLTKLKFSLFVGIKVGAWVELG